jgi:hypothetical protein
MAHAPGNREAGLQVLQGGTMHAVTEVHERYEIYLSFCEATQSQSQSLSEWAASESYDVSMFEGLDEPQEPEPSPLSTADWIAALKLDDDDE